jgi:Flp pilus assembly protein TadD
LTGRSSVTVPPASTSSWRKAGGRGSRSTRRIASTARRATSRTRPRTSTGSSQKAEEARTIPTCSLARAGLAAAALLAPFAPAAASVEDPAALSAYARALAAETLGTPDDAARRYAAALAISPGNEALAGAAFRQALTAGDKALALRAARVLEQRRKLGPDARLLLFADQAERRDWKGARAQLAMLREVELFSFLGPLLEAWLAHGSGKGDPLAHLVSVEDNPLASAYAREHRPLLLLARGRKKEGLAALAALDAAGDIPPRLRLAAAAQLARRGARPEAIALLEGDAPAIAAARGRLALGQPLKGTIATASEGVAEVLQRFGIDAAAAEAPELALALARIAGFAAPHAAPPRLLAAELLARQGRHALALTAASAVARDDPLHVEAADLRLRILSESGRTDEAVAEARAAAAAQGGSVQAWARLGDFLTAAEQYGEAAEAYGKALALIEGGAPFAQPHWGLWLLRGSALTQAGKWSEGKAALERAYKLAPNQAVVLNHLGYSLLERRENLPEAERLIAEASKLQPDDSAITDSLGWAYFVRGDLRRAVELLERAARGEPADPAINEHLGDAYYSSGRRVEARYAWQAALTFAEGDAAARLKAKLEKGLRPELVAP